MAPERRALSSCTALDRLANFDSNRDVIDAVLRNVYDNDTPFFLATAGFG
jgi:hypothetical protein